jgi:hypothetical protein
MRERYLEVFDQVWIDCLNGDKYATGKMTPEGKPDPSIFSTPFNKEGIQVGTAIALLAKSQKQSKPWIGFRDLWGQSKLKTLIDDADHLAEIPYQEITSSLALGLPLKPKTITEAYSSFALISELFPISFPGVQSKNDELVTDIDFSRLRERIYSGFTVDAIQPNP